MKTKTFSTPEHDKLQLYFSRKNIATEIIAKLGIECSESEIGINIERPIPNYGNPVSGFWDVFYDVLKESINKTYWVGIEIKPTLHSLGGAIRQLKRYRLLEERRSEYGFGGNTFDDDYLGYAECRGLYLVIDKLNGLKELEVRNACDKEGIGLILPSDYKFGVVDFLNSTGQPSSFSARAKLAKQFGIQNYVGSAQQNTQLLNQLKS